MMTACRKVNPSPGCLLGTLPHVGVEPAPHPHPRGPASIHAHIRAFLPVDYPFDDRIIIVTRCGRICLGTKKINFSTVFVGQAVGIKEVQDDIWLVSFMDYDLGHFDLETRVLEPLDNPFGPRLSPM